MSIKRKYVAFLTVVALLNLVCAGMGKKPEEDQSTQISKPSFEAFRASSIDRTWVTPIGVAGHRGARRTGAAARPGCS